LFTKDETDDNPQIKDDLSMETLCEDLIELILKKNDPIIYTVEAVITSLRDPNI
jgi:hypothetical protein